MERCYSKILAGAFKTNQFHPYGRGYSEYENDFEKAGAPTMEILVGGLIARSISEGCKIKVLFLGEGSTCRFDDVDSEQAKLAVQKRNDNAVLALQELGVDDLIL